MRYPKLRELKEAIKALIQGPVTTKFPKEPHVPMDGFKGKPVPNDDYCVGCGACAEVCPADAIEIIDEGNTRRIIRHYDQCIFCGQCEAYCTTEKGVQLTKEFDLACFDRSTLFCEQKKELVRCDNCQTVIAPKKQILWLIKKLGPLAYSNYPLIYTIQKELKLAEDEPVDPDKVPSDLKKRQDIYRVLCPKCRHQVLVFDEHSK